MHDIVLVPFIESHAILSRLQVHRSQPFPVVDDVGVEDSGIEDDGHLSTSVIIRRDTIVGTWTAFSFSLAFAGPAPSFRSTLRATLGRLAPLFALTAATRIARISRIVRKSPNLFEFCVVFVRPGIYPLRVVVVADCRGVGRR